MFLIRETSSLTACKRMFCAIKNTRWKKKLYPYCVRQKANDGARVLEAACGHTGVPLNRCPYGVGTACATRNTTVRRDVTAYPVVAGDQSESVSIAHVSRPDPKNERIMKSVRNSYYSHFYDSPYESSAPGRNNERQNVPSHDV